MGEGTIIPLSSKPGIQRDGTMFDSDCYVDGRWVRFVKDKPRKILGYRSMTGDYSGPVRQMYLDARGDTLGLFSGSPSKFEQGYFTESGFGSAPVDRTPSGFAADTNNMWQIDSMFDPTGGGDPVVFAIAAPNLNNIKSQTTGTIYYGSITSNAALTALPTAPAVSGGLAVLYPYLFAYGDNGYVAWSDAANPQAFNSGDAGSANITASKIIRAMAFTGGANSSPGGLFWSLDKVYRASYVGSPNIFQFDFVGESSLIGPDAVVEYDGLYYWIDSNGRFMMYNGTVREIDNVFNKDFFFDNLNRAQSQKVIGTKVPRYGEIWWFFCNGSTATEPNWAIVFNKNLNCWYDTPLPEGGRTAAISPGSFYYPIWAGYPDSSLTGIYNIWMHEFGYDRILGSQTDAINSFFETAMISLASGGWIGSGSWSGKDVNTLTFRMEPDFVQIGDITFNIVSRRTPKSPDVSQAQRFFLDDTEYVDLPQYDGRIIRGRFQSNVQNGNYIMGEPLLHVKEGGGRM